MANVLEVEMQKTIISLHHRGWSQRRICRELGIHRKTVSSYLEKDSGSDSKCTTPITGSGENGVSECTTAISGTSSFQRSECEGYRSQIQDLLSQGLTARRIHQDLASDYGLKVGYQSVQRFIRKLQATTPIPFRRMECDAGEEAQVDFGTAATVIGTDGKRKRPHLFRMVLSYSRKGYSEVVPRQSTEHFIRAIENAFRFFGGVPRKVIIDNLRAAVSKADWYEPDLNPKIRSFCQHYGTVVLPTKVRTPRHKGKVERGIGYVKSNALKGRTFSSMKEQNKFLADWERTVADTRIHGTTRQQVKATFEREKSSLLPLPPMLFPCFQEGRRNVHRDQHIEVDKSYYSVPAEYNRREVWVRYMTPVG